MIGGAHFVRKKLSAGIAWYVYAWRGGPQVLRSDGPARPRLTPAVLRKIVLAHEENDAPDETVFRALIRAWRSQDPARPSSPEWANLAPSTKRTWGSALDRIEERWGDVPLKLFNDPRMRAKIVLWRDSRAAMPRAADIGVTVLHALLKFGMLRGRVQINVAAGVPRLYKGGDRAEIIWTDDDVQRFIEVARSLEMPFAADALRLAVHSGLRREDLTTLTFAQVGDFSIKKRARKRSAGRQRHVTIPMVGGLRTLLAELEQRARLPGVSTVLVDRSGASWTPDRLTKAFNRVRDAARVEHVDEDTGIARKKHLHDARGTYATKLMLSTPLGEKPVTDRQIAEIMGWAPDRVGQIRSVYVDRSAVVVALGERINRGTINQ